MFRVINFTPTTVKIKNHKVINLLSILLFLVIIAQGFLLRRMYLDIETKQVPSVINNEENLTISKPPYDEGLSNIKLIGFLNSSIMKEINFELLSIEDNIVVITLLLEEYESINPIINKILENSIVIKNIHLNNERDLRLNYKLVLEI